MFGRKQPQQPPQPGDPAPLVGGKQLSAATAAAARWLRGGSETPQTSLLDARYESGGTDAAASSSAAGLDGLFADLGSRYGGGSSRPPSVPGSSAPAPSQPPARLIFGKKEDASSESDSLLGGLWGGR